MNTNWQNSNNFFICIFYVFKPTLSTKNSLSWLQIANRMKSFGTLTYRIVLKLDTQRIDIIVCTDLMVQTLFTQFFSCQLGENKRERRKFLFLK